MYFIAALFIVCSLFMSGGDAVAMWSLAVALVGFRLGCRAHEREIERRNNGRR